MPMYIHNIKTTTVPKEPYTNSYCTIPLLRYQVKPLVAISAQKREKCGQPWYYAR
jgi:hypothetical protein